MATPASSAVPSCPELSSSMFELTTSNTSLGALVNITCAAFGHRVVGSHTLLCNKSALWEPGVPRCDWTWELTTQEKVIFGTAVAAVAFVVLIIGIIIIVCCCCKQDNRQEKLYTDSVYGDNPVYSHSLGDVGSGYYPDAYFAYQDMNEKHIGSLNGMSGNFDRPWLGYIPRPKVAEGPYYIH